MKDKQWRDAQFRRWDQGNIWRHWELCLSQRRVYRLIFEFLIPLRPLDTWRPEWAKTERMAKKVRNEYCSNHRKAAMTHKRIANETANACRRIHANACRLWVSRPLNAHYRSLVIRIAREVYGLDAEEVYDSNETIMFESHVLISSAVVSTKRLRPHYPVLIFFNRTPLTCQKDLVI